MSDCPARKGRTVLSVLKFLRELEHTEGRPNGLPAFRHRESTKETNMYFTHGDEERVARVKRATAAFEVRIRNLYEPLAQILSGNRRLKVLPHPTSSFTDGKTIWLAVPLALGDDTPHHKELCGLRDPITKMMQCPMCQVIDDVDATCYHETFHITGDSFKSVNPAERYEALRRITAMKFEGDPEKLSDLLRRVTYSDETNAMELANKLDLYLPMLTNIVEDLYVNAEGFKARPGTIDPMEAMSRKYLTGTWETAEGPTSWAERDFNMRALITVYCLGGFEYAIPGFGEDVKPIAEDPRIIEAVSKAVEQPEAVDRLMLAIEILGYLREHGACVDSRSELFDPIKLVILTDKEEDDDEDGEGGEPLEIDDDTVVIDMRTKPEADSGEGEGEPDDDAEDSEGAKLTPKPTEASEDSDEADDKGSGDGESVDSDDEADEDSEGLGDTADRDGDGEANTDKPLHEAGSGYGDSDEAAESDVKSPSEGEAFSGHDDDTDEARSEAAREAEIELAERIAKELDHAMGHKEGKFKPGDSGEDAPDYRETELLTTWLEQKDFFDEPSFGCTRVGFLEGSGRRRRGGTRGLEGAPSAMDVNPVLTKLRVAFTKNQAMGMSRNLTQGPRLDTAHLYRAPMDDPRLFARRSIPKKRNWFVVIGCDCSGSTSSGAIDVIRKGAYAMAELLSRLGIPFAVYGHSGTGGSGGYKLTFTHVKNPNEPWDDAARSRCMNLEAQSANLDGHTLEYYRRVAEQAKATDKLIMYFTDGAMPCENKAEEERILRKNIGICQRKDIKLVGVGVGNVEPRRYGLDTIRYDHLGELPKLIEELGKRLG